LQEVSKWAKRDSPSSRLRKYLERNGLWDEEKEKAYRTQTRKDIMESFNKAEKRLKPAVPELFTDVYDKTTPMLEEQKREMEEHVKKYPEEYPTGNHATELQHTRHADPKKYL